MLRYQSLDHNYQYGLRHVLERSQNLKIKYDTQDYQSRPSYKHYFHLTE